jgi:signal transduction histidine kinase
MTGLKVSPGSRLRLAASRVVHAATTRLPKAGAVRAFRQVPDWVVDGALAVGFLAAMLIERAESAALPGARQPLAVALSVVIAGALALRRRMPLAAYLAGSSALVAEALWVGPSTVAPYANLIGLYSVGLYAPRGRAWWGPVLVVPGVFVYASGAGSAASASPAAGVLLSWLLAWAVGYGAARRREEQQAARQAMRRQAVADERSRLARELHDLIGHTVNVMVVQAGAGRLVLDRDPAKTREILASLELTGRQALTELDRVLGVLRRDDSQPSDRAGTAAGPRGPGVPLDEEGLTVPGIADLPRLARRMTEAGIRVTVQIDPPSPQVARSVDLSAYRIVQEALTNTMKHGGAGRRASRCGSTGVPWTSRYATTGAAPRLAISPGAACWESPNESPRSGAVSSTAGANGGAGCGPCSPCHDGPRPAGRRRRPAAGRGRRRPRHRGRHRDGRRGRGRAAGCAGRSNQTSS